MAYKSGQKYMVNRVTGAVFQYNDSIAGLKDLELFVADDDGNLVKNPTRSAETTKLNPTKTPEKKADKADEKAKPTLTKAPTMTPVVEE